MGSSMTERLVDDAASSPGTEGPGRECPLCDHTGPTPTDVYTHLMVRHRKSAVSRALLATAPEGSGDAG